MDDLLHQNYPVVTGGTLIAGPLTSGGSALRLSSSGSWVVADSDSSSLTVSDGTAGGAALEGWFRLPSLPSGTQTILGKASSYELKATSAGFVHWIVTNSGNTATVVSGSTVAANTWYHAAGVYNGDYTGITISGNTTQGSLLLAVPPDYRAGVTTGENNLQVTKFALQERAMITSIVVDLRCYTDAGMILQDMAAVVYDDDGGTPGNLLTQSDPQRFGVDPSRRWATFTTDCVAFPGDIWIGFVSGAILANEVLSIQVGYESSGGTTMGKNSVVGDGTVATGINARASDPFGTPALSNSNKLAVYVNYTPINRNGSEGHAALYLNGSSSGSVSYTHGIGDSANNLQHPVGAAVDLESWAIYNNKLTPVQVSTHYSSR